MHLLSFTYSCPSFYCTLEQESLLLLRLTIWGLDSQNLRLLLLLWDLLCSFNWCSFHILVLLNVREISSKWSYMMICLINERVLIERIPLGFIFGQSRCSLWWGVFVAAISLEVVVIPSSWSILLMQWHFITSEVAI